MFPYLIDYAIIIRI